MPVIGNACSIYKIHNTQAPMLVNGEWAEFKKPIKKLPNINYANLIKNHSIIFSGHVEQAFTEDKKISKYIFTDEIWEGHVPELIELDILKNNPTVLDGYCGHNLSSSNKFIFFAEIGTRTTPVIIFKVVADNVKIRKLLKDPIKRWHKGKIVKY